MAYLLRKIEGKYWSIEKPASKKDFPSDPLQDINTQQNTLSFYLVKNKKEDIDKIITAIATTRDYVDKVAYALIKVSDINKSEFQLSDTPGSTPHKEVNDMHKDMVKITASKLALLAKLIYYNGNPTTFPKKDVKKLVGDALKTDKLDKSKIKPSLIEQFKV